MKFSPPYWDCHVHLFTDAMAQDPIAWADQNRETIWKACVAPPNRASIQGWASVDQLLRDMDRADISTVVLQGWYWQTPASCRLHNRFYQSVIEAHPDRILAMATIHPADPKIRDELKWIRDHGFVGIGEIHPQAQGFDLSDSSWQSIVEQIQGWDFAINFHVTDPATRSHSGKVETPLAPYLELAGAWPNQTFILSHLGALIPLREEFVSRASSLSNIYYDCAAIPLLYAANTIAQVAAVVGAEKLLFGSDYPLRVFPKTQPAPEFCQSIAFVNQSGLTDASLQLVFSQNAERLFRR